MTQTLHFGRDDQGYNAYAPMDASMKYRVTLAANTAQSVTLPSEKGRYIVAFSVQGGARVWVDFSATATLPTGTMAPTTSSLNPAQRMLMGGTTISLITADTNADVGIEVFSTGML